MEGSFIWRGKRPWSGRLARPADASRARGTAVFVHGGGVGSGYFDGGSVPELSLLTQFADAGFIALAPDRPGYGETPEFDALRLIDHAEWLAEFVGSLELADGSPLFLLGHSLGSMVATAATTILDRVDGLAISGVSAAYQPERIPDVTATNGPRLSSDLWWGDLRLYPHSNLQSKRSVVFPVTKADRAVAPNWPEDVKLFAPRCRVPVQVSIGDADQWWVGGTLGLDALAAQFSAAPWVDRYLIDSSSHNTSLGWTARSYGFRALSFFENVIAWRRGADDPADG
ncbi:MAG: alpha/beta hydrolase [Aeromicrobium sp.]